ncbi:uncharacterized protein LOC113938356 [Zalophus californianus]|uniref:Uncharacterized protein LOC113938356 n=1 Tax=Zalophus californianus TaxID=9704 RepID=A0A6J2FHW5_ZALCA|nr:uncharacterized protein LOC113938356 [Zalophus californianus]
MQLFGSQVTSSISGNNLSSRCRPFQGKDWQYRLPGLRWPEVGASDPECGRSPLHSLLERPRPAGWAEEPGATSGRGWPSCGGNLIPPPPAGTKAPFEAPAHYQRGSLRVGASRAPSRRRSRSGKFLSPGNGTEVRLTPGLRRLLPFRPRRPPASGRRRLIQTLPRGLFLFHRLAQRRSRFPTRRPALPEGAAHGAQTCSFSFV